GAPSPRSQLFRARRSRPRRLGSDREPVLPLGAGLGLAPARAPVDRSDDYRIASGDLRRFFAVTASDAARSDAAPRHLPNLDPGTRPDLYPPGQLAALDCRYRTGLGVPELE